MRPARRARRLATKIDMLHVRGTDPVFYYFKIIATRMLQVLEIYAAMCVMSCGCVICEAGRDLSLIRVLVRTGTCFLLEEMARKSLPRAANLLWC